MDTNVILCYLVKDNPTNAEHCLELINKAERREIQLYLSELVIAELVWVLESKRFGLSPTRIRDLLMPVIELPGVRLANKGLYGEIFALYVELKIDFIDAYNAVVMQRLGLTEIFSYDHDFDRIAGLKRLEP